MEEDVESEYRHTVVSGALNQHARSYWRLALPAIGTRYLARYAQNVSGLTSNRFFDAVAGAWMLGITAYYTYLSEKDLKRVFSETVAYDLGKKPSEVTIPDLVRSKNKAVRATHNNLMIHNTLRTAVNSTFFACFLPWKRFQGVDSVDLGVGLNGAYMVYDILGHGNTTTFFEQLQHFLSAKIDQKHSMGDNVTAIDLMQLYDRYAVDNDKQNVIGEQTDSKVWRQSNLIFGHMADLMNRTYQRQYNGEGADFIVPKFLYLLGHNLIQPTKPEQTLAYIDVANLYGIAALKQVVKAVKEGKELAGALRDYPVSVTTETSPRVPQSKSIVASPAGGRCACGTDGRGAKEEPAARFTDKVTRSGGTVNSPGV